ncbi:MAG: succinate dehydrogenase, cytochrome b556 subunit [gamma proteobacterium symbiont of Ctena orbiculata]|uniref:Succinate dehydrogenase cytochrome b556 subunit n=1 Tax=Candidatus Thiodiazotropha taylori TaxID=2792791 RepID=A0A944QTU3_9GAMM|nr:succinate dehydrogenase, cytochrome b556 subunit [Candidatus Thiodiazotropha taylori]PUB88147.1 MAG: succinate dehydrogenase, cytochrome b556 subunit [gamma proteobacterium symbiont of Ctena orbiculata]MBT2989447.1 succinate dehydrogenase, cytochrome b556 subunit [Candidatus Thiodiazotropha taylori]MBT2997027.1 succinate dehydrogenase, cytochrome b556 subunit [Candidatus Thiodiazotropha taylori]MBT3000882.1 succinate dehydrogenase, cytochrome b556 subunit [Candidatus Thiodiazotropha taylori]
MQQTNPRPVFLNLFKIRLPMAGVMSIIHRATGVLMVLAIPLLIYLLDLSLSGSEGFAAAKGLFASGLAKLILFLFLWGLMHHFLAGIRYLLIDIDVGVEKPLFRQTAWAVTVAAPLLALVLLGGLS